MKQRFNWPVRVYYEDTDAGGVVFYANYLKFYERARTEMLRVLGFEQDVLIEEQNILFVVKSVQIDYLKPGRFNDLLSVSAEVQQIKRASMVFHQEIKRETVLLSRAEIKIACLDAVQMKPKIIPQEILEKLNND